MQEFEGPADYAIFLATALDGVLERLSMRWFGDALLTERRHRCSLLNERMQRPMPIFRNRRVFRDGKWRRVQSLAMDVKIIFTQSRLLACVNFQTLTIFNLLLN